MAKTGTTASMMRVALQPLKSMSALLTPPEAPLSQSVGVEFQRMRNEVWNKTLPEGWIVVSGERQDNLELNMFTSQFRNGVRVVKTIIIERNLQLQARVHNVQVPVHFFRGCCGRSTSIDNGSVRSFEELVEILQYFRKCTMCKGLTNSDYSALPQQVYNAKREVIGRTEEVSSDADGACTLQIKRSLLCVGVLRHNLSKSGSKEQSCPSCSSMKNTLDVALHRLKKTIDTTFPDKNNHTSSRSTANWRFLGTEEKRERELDERKRRINTKKEEISEAKV